MKRERWSLDDFDGAHLSPYLRLYFDRKNEYPSVRKVCASSELAMLSGLLRYLVA